jgi:hypothetical protein
LRSEKIYCFDDLVLLERKKMTWKEKGNMNFFEILIAPKLEGR